jgi:hypothetical protein
MSVPGYLSPAPVGPDLVADQGKGLAGGLALAVSRTGKAGSWGNGQQLGVLKPVLANEAPRLAVEAEANLAHQGGLQQRSLDIDAVFNDRQGHHQRDRLGSRQDLWVSPCRILEQDLKIGQYLKHLAGHIHLFELQKLADWGHNLSANKNYYISKIRVLIPLLLIIRAIYGLSLPHVRDLPT